mmetsp:Transcript_14494/g.41168  ORF Transcript_14494/g.41168 Transcript_14494/m.41168 type:complete len:205 (+) Transcript_14494:9-623(+)
MEAARAGPHRGQQAACRAYRVVYKREWRRGRSGVDLESAGIGRDSRRLRSRRAPPPFHLAIPVTDLQAARDFYGGSLGCPEGRSAATWVDFNLYGHQVVCHVVEGYSAAESCNAVDGDPVPVPHFGLAMLEADFHALASRLKKSGVRFIIEPHLRFRGQPGEQWTMFFKDPSGNSLEFKAMTNPENLFAKYTVAETADGAVAEG